ETKLVEHPAIPEARGIPNPDPVRAQIIKPFIPLTQQFHPSRKLKEHIPLFLNHPLAPHPPPPHIQFKHNLPKTPTANIITPLLNPSHLNLPPPHLSTIHH
ncbi:AMP-binding enzyme, partial [Bacillus subtilis]|uniref:AMP-binding enzyme n=1 Tax=Bacillus subtilis TaxID=1423 RepID=UPI003F4D5F07